MSANSGISVGGRKIAGVLIVDDHPVVRKGLADAIATQPDLEVLGEADSVESALRAIAATSPDMIMLDLSLGSGSGLDLLKDIRIRWPALPVLVLSVLDESVYAERALHAGARGYVMKEEPVAELLDAVRNVLAGRIHLSRSMTARLLTMVADGHAAQDPSPVSGLSDRELQVFEMIGRGMGTREIAGQLHLSIKTIESHRAHLKEKLSLRSAVELQYHAIKWVDQNRTA